MDLGQIERASEDATQRGNERCDSLVTSSCAPAANKPAQAATISNGTDGRAGKRMHQIGGAAFGVAGQSEGSTDGLELEEGEEDEGEEEEDEEVGLDEIGDIMAIKYGDIEACHSNIALPPVYGSGEPACGDRLAASKRHKMVRNRRDSDNYLTLGRHKQNGGERSSANQLVGDINTCDNDSTLGNSNSNSLCNMANRSASAASYASSASSSSLSSCSPLAGSTVAAAPAPICPARGDAQVASECAIIKVAGSHRQQSEGRDSTMSPEQLACLPTASWLSSLAGAPTMPVSPPQIRIPHTSSAPAAELQQQAPDLVHQQHEHERQFMLNLHQQHTSSLSASSFAGDLRRNQSRHTENERRRSQFGTHNGDRQQAANRSDQSDSNRCDGDKNVPKLNPTGEQRQHETRGTSEQQRMTGERALAHQHQHQHHYLPHYLGSRPASASAAVAAAPSKLAGQASPVYVQQEAERQQETPPAAATASPSSTLMLTPASSSSVCGAASTSTNSSTSTTSTPGSSCPSNPPNGLSSGQQSAPMFTVQHHRKQNEPQPNQLQKVSTSNYGPQSNSQLARSHKHLEGQPHSIHHHNHQQQQQEQQHLQQQIQDHSQQQQPLQRQYPPNHPLGNTKHLCSICGDRATGKHYGVYSCEGCKGFFKRTIRKDIVYVCRANGNCLIDMRQRNRCQYCRYQKCLRQGMKREAVQEEKQRLKLKACAAGLTNCDNQVESTSNLMIGQSSLDSQNSHLDVGHITAINLPYGTTYNNGRHHQKQRPSHDGQPIQISDIVEAQLDACDRSNSTSSQPHYDFHPANSNHHYDSANQTISHYHQPQHPLNNRLPVMRDFNGQHDTNNDSNNYYSDFHQSPRKYSRIDDLTLKWAAQMQIEQLLDWAKSVPKFTELLIDDQITLLRAYWNELIISEIAFKSIDAFKENQSTSNKSLCIGRGLYINENQAYEIGLSNMFERIISELVVKMHDMRVDSNELACLRAIILFNPETHGLKSAQPIEEYRGNVYTALEMYCRKAYDDQPNRFGKLLLRLPALRSIGLKCDCKRRCDINNNSNNNIQLSGHESSANNTGQPGGASPSGSATMLGYQVKLLFFDICYEASAIDSFLRSNLLSNRSGKI